MMRLLTSLHRTSRGFSSRAMVGDKEWMRVLAPC